MRTIKFRGKSKKTGEWLYGSLLQRFDCDFIYTDDCNGLFIENEVDTKTIGQFTGLCDKNGKEIYEGDILRLANSPSSICEVRWNDSITSFCIRLSYENELGSKPLGEWAICERDIKIIGNIHDNPELLKQ